MATLKLTAALVLCDVVAHGLKAGQIVEASADVVQALAKVGEVDPHREAVAYARSQGAVVARSCIELAAEARAAAASALRVRIAELEALSAKDGTDVPTREAIEADIAKHKAELAQIAG